MDGNTVIGFRHVSVKAYCARCKQMFSYGYNACKPLSASSRCPTCNKGDRVETNHGIDSHIQFLQAMRGNLPRDKTKALNDEIYELYRIKGEFNGQH